MATTLEITHDAGLTVGTYWTTVTDPAGLITLTVPAALGGSVWGLSAILGTADNRTLLEPISAPGSNELRFRWRFDPNSIVVPIGSGTGQVMSAGLRYGGVNRLVQTRFSYNNAGDRIFRALKFDDNDIGNVEVVNVALTDEPHCIEVRIIRESFDGGNDGELQIFLDTVSQYNANNIQNFNAFGNLDQLVMSFNPANPLLVTGTAYADEFKMTDVDTAEMNCAFYPDFIPASVGSRSVDIDADGTFLYIAARSGVAGSVLIKFPTTLAADGNLVFSPGAGSVIGVQCGDLDADVIWVAGGFGGTDTVAKSENAGGTFVIKDDGTIGTIRAFAVGPNDDIRVYVSDSNQVYLETIDDGVTWIIRNNVDVIFDAAVIARLDTSLEEMVFGNEYSAGNLHNVDFTPNSGINLEDIATTEIKSAIEDAIIG